MRITDKNGNRNATKFDFNGMEVGDWFECSPRYSRRIRLIALVWNGDGGPRRYEVSYGTKICVRRIK